MSTYGNSIHIQHPGCHFIDGRWHAAQGSQTAPVIDPSTEKAQAGFVLGGIEDAEIAIDAGRRAFDRGGWPDASPQERARLLKAVADALEARRAELEEAWTLQVGALATMRGRAVTNGLAHFRRAAEQASCFERERSVSSSLGEAMLRFEPVGVVSAIAAWNGTLLQLASKVAPALAAGCTIIMKPAPSTPMEAVIIAECAEAIGLPPGVLNMVLLTDEAAERLVTDPRVDKVAFTGSTAVGRRIARICADRVARYSLELGGKSAAIVLNDADVGAVGKVMGRTITALSGQLCSMLSRVVVSSDRHDALVEAIAAEMATVKIGSAHDPQSQMGPLALARQRTVVENFVAGGKASGARLAYGGCRPEAFELGYFFEPTLFADVDADSPIAQQEIFGPVLSLIPARDEEHAIELANRSVYGLHGAVFTGDKERARAVARRVRTGTFAQNGMKLDFALPFGGFKQSGIGREGGAHALEAYVESKTILLEN
jgi:aldehyde dehydrogenase (NAD+)